MLAVLVLLFAPQAVSPEVLQHVQAGMQARKQGRTDTAITEFKKVTELQPQLAAAFVNLAAAYMDRHDYGSAIPALKRALELNADLPGAHEMLGYALLAQGYAAEAVPHLEIAKAAGALGIAQLETGKLADAIANLQAALAARPNDPDLLYYLGRASGLLSKQSFDTLLAGSLDSPRAHQALAETYAAMRRVPDAEKEYRAAINLRPDTPGLHLGLGQVYAGASQWVKAEEEFRAESALRPGDGEAAYRLGAALLEEGKVHEARQQLERADHLQPGMPETLYALGKAAALDNDSALAEKSWKEVIALEQESPLAAQAHFGLAGLYRKRGQSQKAEQEMLEFRRLQKTPPR